MPIKLKNPTTTRFDLLVSDEFGVERLVKAPEGQPGEGYVEFRQATTADVEKRTAVLSKRSYSSDQDDKMVVTDETNFDFLFKTEVALTLIDTNILLPDETRLEFENGHIKDRTQFDKWWGALPPHWAAFLHDLCVEVSIVWGPKRIH